MGELTRFNETWLSTLCAGFRANFFSCYCADSSSLSLDLLATQAASLSNQQSQLNVSIFCLLESCSRQLVPIEVGLVTRFPNVDVQSFIVVSERDSLLRFNVKALST